MRADVSVQIPNVLAWSAVTELACVSEKVVKTTKRIELPVVGGILLYMRLVRASVVKFCAKLNPAVIATNNCHLGRRPWACGKSKILTMQTKMIVRQVFLAKLEVLKKMNAQSNMDKNCEVHVK